MNAIKRAIYIAKDTGSVVYDSNWDQGEYHSQTGEYDYELDGVSYKEINLTKGAPYTPGNVDPYYISRWDYDGSDAGDYENYYDRHESAFKSTHLPDYPRKKSLGDAYYGGPYDERYDWAGRTLIEWEIEPKYVGYGYGIIRVTATSGGITIYYSDPNASNCPKIASGATSVYNAQIRSLYGDFSSIATVYITYKFEVARGNGGWYYDTGSEWVQVAPYYDTGSSWVELGSYYDDGDEFHGL